MALYSYSNIQRSSYKRSLKIFSIISITIGLTILITILYPIIGFDFIHGSKFVEFTTPIPDGSFPKIIKNNTTYTLNPISLNSESSIVNLITGINTNPDETINLNPNIDYTKARYWFPKAETQTLPRSTTIYTLSIPKLNIYDAKVLIGSEDLTKSLIHYTGPLPEEKGNSVILGHSTILPLYNPSDYKTIFSKLPEMEINDEISVYVDNVTYFFKVYDMKVVQPDDLSVLNTQSDYPDITLITCVPPGTYKARLIVKARLKKI